ncbi:MAG: hypothetical protein PHO94_05645 [Petrimonas sp.]|nr:hypothetical protein [Petrimonas sp.]
MKSFKEENFRKVDAIRSKILNFYPFRKEGDTLTCKLSSSNELIFRLFYDGGTVDLCEKVTKFGVEREKSIILSFSFENDEHRKLLNELIKNREK